MLCFPWSCLVSLYVTFFLFMLQGQGEDRLVKDRCACGYVGKGEGVALILR